MMFGPEPCGRGRVPIHMIKKLFTTVTTVTALTFTTLPAQADGLKDLETFLSEVGSAQAGFTQVVTSPVRNGETVARRKTSSGRFEFLRPNRFRFEYTKPFEQTIVADGQTLWLYDVDLNQVTQRSQSQALGSTPAALLASAPDLSALKADGNLLSSDMEPEETTNYEIGTKWDLLDQRLSLAAALFRTGNSGSIYFVVDGVTYGPVAPGAQVAKDIPLHTLA